MTDFEIYISEPTPEIAVDRYYQNLEDAEQEAAFSNGDGPTLEEDELAEIAAARVEQEDARIRAALVNASTQQINVTEWSDEDEEAASLIADFSSPYDPDFERVLERVEARALAKAAR